LVAMAAVGNGVGLRVAVITAIYPSARGPTEGTFVREIARGMQREGAEVSVVHPQPIHEVRRALGVASPDVTGGDGISVLRPVFASLGARVAFERFGPLSPSAWTLRAFRAAAVRTILSSGIRFDAVYGHFLAAAGVAAVSAAQALGVSGFIGVGESVERTGRLWTVEQYGVRRIAPSVLGAAGLFVNSSLLARSLRTTFSIPGDRLHVLPNGVDLDRFRPAPREEARRNLGLPDDAMIITCVGSYSDRKGQDRLAQAIAGLDGVALAFIGEGVPVYPAVRVVKNGPVEHDAVPMWLNASDAFALPTLAEGSSNATIEAMACGLAIIASDRPFNDDILRDQDALKVDPTNVAAIRAAVVRLRDEPDVRLRLGRAALESAQGLGVDVRSRRILDEMVSRSGAVSPRDHATLHVY
jgi:teichuronic acid biosynthesis glycosyltransferase TuaC